MSRTPYCTGCGVTFTAMNLMINHRRQERCGGRFLPEAEMWEIIAAKNIRQFAETLEPLDQEQALYFAQGHLKHAADLRNMRRK